MPGYAVDNLVGIGPLADMFGAPDTTQRAVLGTRIRATDPYFGGAEFVYGKAAAAQENGSVVYQSDEAFTMTDVPNTANLGHPLLVARQAFANPGEFGWYQVAGMCPVSAAASVAAGAAVGIGAVGQVGTNTAGKQVLGMTVLKASTFTLTKAATTSLQPGKKRTIQVTNVDGLFVGLSVSGTGVGASAKIVKVDPSGNFIQVDVDSTAAGSLTLTGTYTGYLLANLNYPFAQGAIT